MLRISPRLFPVLFLALACSNPPVAADDVVNPLVGHWQMHYYDLEGHVKTQLVICIATLDFNFTDDGGTITAKQIGDNVMPCYGSQTSPYPDFIVKGETIPHVVTSGDSIAFEFGTLVNFNRGRVIGDSMEGTSTWNFHQSDGSTVTVTGPWAAKKR